MKSVEPAVDRDSARLGVRLAYVAACVSFALTWIASHEAAAQDDLGLDDAPSGDVEEGDAPSQGAEVEGDVGAGLESEAGGEVGLDAEAGGEVGLDAEADVEVGDEPAAPALGTAAGGEEEIVVTGSRLKRTNYSLPSSVQVISRRELAQSGANNMADVVRYTNINYGSNLNTDVSTAAGGTTQFNLRGLGLNSTLVLLNGRRLVYSGALSSGGNNFVDVNTIPIAMIERIEILKGGASAIYGSDAVAGVVNIITDKTMDGFDVEIGAQTTDDFDQSEHDLALVGGWSAGKTRLNAMISYFNRSPLRASERDFTLGDNGIGYNVSAFGNPSGYRELVPNTDPATMAVSPVIPTPYVDPGCPASYGESPDYPYSFADAGAGFCRFSFGPFFDLVADMERANLYLTAEHDIGDHTRIFIEGGYARNRTRRGVSPSFPILAPPLVPADHLGIPAPTGNSFLWLGRAIGAGPPGDPLATGDTQFFDSDTIHTVAGVGGDFGSLTSAPMIEDWEWEVAGTWSVNRYRITLQDTLSGPLQDALNSCSDPADTSDCFNPFTTGPVTTPEVVDRITGKLISLVDTTLTTMGVGFAGPVVELPGGDLGLAFGAQIRNEEVVSYQDHDSNEQNYVFLVGVDDYEAERRIMAGYGELTLPFFEGFELQAAARYEDYEDAGSSIDPKLGLSWTPAETFLGGDASDISRIRLRGTIATSFRAPTLLQGNGSQTELQNIFDTADDGMGNMMRPMTGVFRAVVTQGNPGLEPETSTAITGGFEWEPTKGLLIDGDYFRYDYEKIIVKEAAQPLVDADFQCVTMGICNPQVVRDATTGSIVQVNTRFINASQVTTDGIDLNALYRSDFGANAGEFSFGVGGVYLLSYTIPDDSLGDPTLPDLDCSGGECDVAGSRNQENFAPPLPRLRATIPLGWKMDMHDIGLFLRLTSGYKNDADVDAMTMAFADIDAMFTIDLQYAIRIDEGDEMATTLKLGVLNLLDTDPPAVADNYGYDALTHDPRGRLLYVRLVQEL